MIKNMFCLCCRDDLMPTFQANHNTIMNFDNKIMGTGRAIKSLK